MKTSYRFTLLALVLLLPLFFIKPVLAVNRDKNKTRSEYLCGKIAGYSEQIRVRTEGVDGKLTERLLNKEKLMIQNRASRDSKLAEYRSTWEDNRDENYKKLEERATTQAQKDAVSKFKLQVEEAVKLRQEAVDKAQFEFRSSVDELLEERSNSVDTNLENYKKTVEEALANVQTRCQAGSGPEEIRTDLLNELRQAKDAFKVGVESYGDVRSEVEALRKTRDEAIHKAISDFKVSLNEAKEELKLAFKS